MALLAGGGIGLAACGSAQASAAPTTTTTVLKTTGPGWKDGYWVGTGSATDQAAVYLAKRAINAGQGDNIAEGKALAPDLEWSQVQQFWAKKAKMGIEPVLDSLNPGDPAGMKLASFKITQSLVSASGSTVGEVTIKLCGADHLWPIDTATGQLDLNASSWAGLAVWTATERYVSTGWQIRGWSSGKAVATCPSTYQSPTNAKATI